MAAEGKDVDVTDQPDTAGITADVGGISLMQRLRIPFAVSVFDECILEIVSSRGEQTNTGWTCQHRME